MMPLTYCAHLEHQGADGFLVRFPDVPEALTQGATEKQAAQQAEDALAVALEGYFLEGRDVPPPTVIAAGLPVIAVEIPIRPVVAAR